MHDRFRPGKVLRPDLTTKMFAASECEVEAELFIQQDDADGLDSEIGEDAEAKLCNIATRRFGCESSGLGLGLGTGARDPMCTSCLQFRR